MNRDLVPIPFDGSNDMGFGRPLTEAEKMSVDSQNGQISDIPFYKEGPKRITQWYCESIWARLIFLLTGKITMLEMGGITPKALVVGEVNIKPTIPNNEEKHS